MSNVIVCIGDSLTAGQFVQPHQAWPRLLYGHDIYPAGVSGDTTRLGLERFPQDVQALLPKAVVIQFGHNDCNRWATDRGMPRVSVGVYEANLYEMIERCLMFDATPFLCSLIPSRRSERHTTDVRRYNEILLGVADEEEVEVIDVRAAFGTGDGMLIGDGIHPTVEGHRLYAAQVQRALDGRFPHA